MVNQPKWFEGKPIESSPEQSSHEPGVPSKAIVVICGGVPAVVYQHGTALAYWGSEVLGSPKALAEELAGDDASLEGVFVWSGTIKAFRSYEGEHDEELVGELRPIAADEWARYVDDEHPFLDDVDAIRAHDEWVRKEDAAWRERDEQRAQAAVMPAELVDQLIVAADNLRQACEQADRVAGPACVVCGEVNPEKHARSSRPCPVVRYDFARAQLALHPTGKCTCGGDGQCDWCRQLCEDCGGDGNGSGVGGMCIRCRGTGRDPDRAPEPPVTRSQLRRIVDRAWNQATESTQVPDTTVADFLIDRALSESPDVEHCGGCESRVDSDGTIVPDCPGHEVDS